MENLPVQLFDAHLVYDADAQRISDDVDRDRTYLGSGTGTVHGAVLSGSVAWDLFEAQGETSCDARFVLRIDTEDDARIEAEVVGLLQRPLAGDSVWTMAAGIRFVTEDKRYAYLDGLLAIWKGTFDASTYRHTYSVSPLEP